MKYTLYENLVDEVIKKSENAQELLDVLAERCLDNGHELDLHRLVDENGNKYPLASTIIAAGINEIADAGVSAKLALIAAIYKGYYNTNQATVDFAEEFFFAVGNILKGTKKEDLNLKHLVMDEIDIGSHDTAEYDNMTITLSSIATREAYKNLKNSVFEFLHKRGLSCTIDNATTSNTLTIILTSVITPEAHEKLEDALSEFLHDLGLSGTIDNAATGNTTQIKRRRKYMIKIPNQKKALL